jgi:hypothetical protein
VIDSPFIVYDASGKEIQAGRTQRNEYLEFKDGQWKLSTRGTSMPASSTLSATSRPAAQPAVP